MPAQSDAAPAAAFLAAPGDMLILAHERPDGDALGAVVACLLARRANGLGADACLPGEIPGRYRRFVPEDVKPVPEAKAYSHVLCLDCGSAARVANDPALQAAVAGKPVLNIDHHPDNSNFGDLNLVVPTASSTCEIVLGVLRALGWSLPRPVLDALLVGVLTDTGGLRFDNSSPATFRAMADLLELGGDFHGVVKAMFSSKPLSLVKFEADVVLSQMRTACLGRFAYFHMSQELLAAHGLSKKDTEGVIDAIRVIDGVEVVALLYQDKGRFRVSLRSDDPRYNVGSIARRLGGGGHDMAAASYIDGAADFPAAEAIILGMVSELFV